MKRILITGVNGMIGSAIAEFLSLHFEVIGASIEDSNSTGLNIKYFKIDISDKDSLNALPKEIDVIIHCAAILTNDDNSNLLVSTNCIGIQNMAIYSKNAHCQQFIYISSLPIIGRPLEIPITEEHPINPLSVYHITKYFGEMVLKQMLNENQVAIFRIPSPLGRKLSPNKIVSVFVRNAIKGLNIRILGQGKRIQNYIDVRDISQAVDCAIKKKAFGVFNIASNNSYSNTELAQLCIKLFNSKSTIEYFGIDNDENNQWIVATEKAEKELGFTAHYSLSETLKEIAKNFPK